MSAERRSTLARFIRSQANLTDAHPHTPGPGPGNVRLNNEEALLCAVALELVERMRPYVEMASGIPMPEPQWSRMRALLEELK